MDEPTDATSVATTGKRRTGPASFHQRHDDALDPASPAPPDATPDATASTSALGWAVIVGAALYKLPQIRQIISTRSASGISLAATAQDLAAYAFTFAYSAAHGHAFSTYGENLFQGIGTGVVLLLQLRLNHGRSRAQCAVAAAAAVVSVWALARAKALLGEERGDALLSTARASTLALALSAKLPQIASNHASGVGELNLTSSALVALGSLVRTFTTLKSVALRADRNVVAGALLSLSLNSIVVAQILSSRGGGGGGGGGGVRKR